MSFIDNFKEKSTIKTTENGALAYTSVGSKLLDFFSIIGGMRDRNEEDIVRMYHEAREEDKELADKIILYVSNIREGGLGERRIGKILMKELAKIDPAKVKRNFQTFINNSRFDCLYALEGTPVELEMWQFMREILLKDIELMRSGQPISLAAKWLKSPNTSSEESRRLAKKFCNITGMSERVYRKSLALLRKYSNVVETKMSTNQWKAINFETVPSYAMKRYSQAFERHCSESFSQYIDNLIEGKNKINSNVLFPHDIIYQFIYGGGTNKEILEAQWKSLPNYFKEGRNVVCCADVSGSMIGIPMAASVGLALYCASHNTGAYHGTYLTFTDEPRFFTLNEKVTIEKNVQKVMENYGFNTNLDGMLEAIFDIAKKEKDAPEALLIVSDSEIDSFIAENEYDDIVTKWALRYKEIELECPKIIFWNCKARQNTYLAKSKNPYVNFISGVSAGTFSHLSQLIDYTPYESMCKILEQYNFI